MANDRPLILVVDDDADFQDIMRHILTNAGYRVTCCLSPDEAMDTILDEEPATVPALIITDLMMDTLDAGFIFAARIREDERLSGIPIILVTAAGSVRGYDFHPREAQDLNAMNIDAYFDKPVSPKVLLAKVTELLATVRNL